MPSHTLLSFSYITYLSQLNSIPFHFTLNTIANKPHSGGEEVLLDVGGQDATDAFEDVGHSDEAREILAGLLVGTVKRIVRVFLSFFLSFALLVYRNFENIFLVSLAYIYPAKKKKKKKKGKRTITSSHILHSPIPPYPRKRNKSKSMKQMN